MADSEYKRRPRGFWPPVIQEALHALGGQARISPIYEWIAEHHSLWPRDLEFSRWNRPKAYHTVNGIANDMAHKGQLAHLNGVYRLQ